MQTVDTLRPRLESLRVILSEHIELAPVIRNEAVILINDTLAAIDRLASLAAVPVVQPPEQRSEQVEALALWLDMKWKRHGEEEDRDAAQMLRDLFDDYLRLLREKQAGHLLPAWSCGWPTTLRKAACRSMAMTSRTRMRPVLTLA